MDAWFSREISKEDMVAFLAKYDQQMSELQKRLEEALTQQDNSDSLRRKLQSEINAILNGETENTAFCKTILDNLTIFKDRHMELRLNWLPQVFHFIG